MGTPYATREAVKAALDVMETARSNARIDGALAAAADSILGLTKREFRPYKRTKLYPWPNNQTALPWRLWLTGQPDQLIEVESVTSGGHTIAASGYYLEPNEQPGWPFDLIEINLGSNSSWSAGPSTTQRSIAIAGTWGFQLNETAVGTAAEVLDNTETGLDVDGPASGALGVGDLIRIDTERLAITGRQSLTTGQVTSGALASDARITGVGVADGTTFGLGEIITIDTERMLIDDVTGNTLLVERAYDGTALAAHSGGATVYAQRRLTVTRGAQGSAAAGHSNAAPIYRHDVPGLVNQLAIAEAASSLLNLRAGMARTAGTGDAQFEISGKSLGQLRRDVVAAYGRRHRHEAV